MIHETEWKQVPNALYEIKHFWAEKGNHIYVVPAHRTYGIGLDIIPTQKLTGAQFIKKDILNTEEEAKRMVEEWLNK